MTEQQQYRVIADRDKGDDPQNWDRVEAGDRVVVTHSDGEFWPVRIERPVPTTDEPTCDCGAPLAVCTAAFRGTGARGTAKAFDLLPKPVPELRVINLGHLDSFIQGWFDADPESQEISRELREDIAKHFDMPDPMTVIEHALTHGPRGVADVIGPEAYIRVGNAIERIRAALEGATQ